MNEIVNSPVRVLETEKGWFVLIDDALYPVSNWYDEDGDECEPSHALYCVAGNDVFGWMTIELAAPLNTPTEWVH